MIAHRSLRTRKIEKYHAIAAEEYDKSKKKNSAWTLSLLVLWKRVFKSFVSGAVIMALYLTASLLLSRGKLTEKGVASELQRSNNKVQISQNSATIDNKVNRLLDDGNIDSSGVINSNGYGEEKKEPPATVHLEKITYSQVFNDLINDRTKTELPDQNTWLRDPQPVAQDENHATIPKIINKLFFQDESGFNNLLNKKRSLKDAHESWTKMNPGYDIRYFDLGLARKYLNAYFHPAFLRAFDCIEAYSGKTNLFRFALLYREGGWHSDWKQVCLEENILRNISAVTDFYATTDDGNKFAREHQCVQTAFVGAIPQHPFIAKTLELILLHVQSQHYGKAAHDTTGTCVFGEAVKRVGNENASMKKHFKDVAGKFTEERPHCFTWKGASVVRHKCEDCDGGNSWTRLYSRRKYYCEDAASIFTTTA